MHGSCGWTEAFWPEMAKPIVITLKQPKTGREASRSRSPPPVMDLPALEGHVMKFQEASRSGAFRRRFSLEDDLVVQGARREMFNDMWGFSRGSIMLTLKKHSNVLACRANDVALNAPWQVAQGLNAWIEKETEKLRKLQEHGQDASGTRDNGNNGLG